MEQPTEWAECLLERLQTHGYQPVSAVLGDGHEVSGGRRADFRFAWSCTRLHTFVLVNVVETATAENLGELIDASTAYAIRNKGGLPRGFQTGVAVLPVMVCRTADVEAVALAERRPPKKFASFTLPMLVELDRSRFVTYSDPQLWGAFYQDFLGTQQRLVAGDLDGRVLPPGGEGRARKLVLRAAAVGGVLAVLFLALTLGIAISQ